MIINRFCYNLFYRTSAMQLIGVFQNRVVFSVAMFLIFCNSFAQQQTKIDALEKKLQTSKDDVTKIEVLTSLGELYLRADPAKARKYCITALELSNKLNYAKGKVNSCNTIGNSYYLEGNYGLSLDYYLKALKVVEETGDKKGIANSMMGIGNIYSAQSNYTFALEYLQKSLKIREELADKDGISACFNNMGVIYMELKNYDKALDYQLKSFKLKQETGDKKGMSSNLGNIGTIYFQQGKYTLALEYQLKAFEIRKELNNKKGMAMSYIDLGTIYEKQEKYEDAIQSQLNAIQTAREVGYKVALKTSYLGLSSVYEKQNNIPKALEYYKLYTEIKDSIFNTENSAKLIEMQTKFDTERKEKEIDLLTKGREIMNLQASRQQLELDNKKMETIQKTKEIELKKKELHGQKLETEAKDKELKIQEAEVDKQRMMRNSVTGGLLLVCALAFLLIIGIRQKQKANKKLEYKNLQIEQASQIIERNRDEIAEKNKNITNSINYARRIQQALLPTQEDINKTLSDYFIFYKPKDIVSGDFYFHAIKNEKTILAIIDGTGHGVPGAFMGMIGNDMLNHIIIEKGITRPAEILNLLNKSVKKALKQETSNSETSDGMDIALCTIDFKNNKLEFAGAMRPLFHINKELIEIPGDKTSIGGPTDDNYQFSNQVIDFEQGDSIYMFTDGYVDQFGGETGKKFMTKNFKNLIANNHHKIMQEQNEVLKNTYTEWARGSEQIDDILVMGIRF